MKLLNKNIFTILFVTLIFLQLLIQIDSRRRLHTKMHHSKKKSRDIASEIAAAINSRSSDSTFDISNIGNSAADIFSQGFALDPKVPEAGQLISKVLGAWSKEPSKFCWKRSYGRGAGIIPKACASNEENDSGLCYKRCRRGYKMIGPLCYTKCRPGDRDDGLTCFHTGTLIIFSFKGSYPNGAGTIPKNCPQGYENDAGLCYNTCEGNNMYGVGPVCWTKCTNDSPVNCGAACASSSGACASGIIGMFASVFDVFYNISKLVLTFGTATAIETSINIALKAAHITANSLAKQGASKESVKEAMKAAALKKGETISEQLLEKLVDEAFKGKEFDFKDFAGLDPTGIATAVLTFIKSVC